MKLKVTLSTLLCLTLSIPALAETWKGLEVREEYDDEECPSYRSVSKDYQYSSNTDLVIEQLLGGFYSPYDDIWYDEATDVDVEHMVARKEAHESGLCKATPEVRYAFANDMLNLTLCTPSLNRNEKSDKDAADWLPQYNKCWYVFTVIQVKQKYKMSVNVEERDAMQEVLDTCTADEIFLEPEKPDDTDSSDD